MHRTLGWRTVANIDTHLLQLMLKKGKNTTISLFDVEEWFGLLLLGRLAHVQEEAGNISLPGRRQVEGCCALLLLLLEYSLFRLDKLVFGV